MSEVNNDNIKVVLQNMIDNFNPFGIPPLTLDDIITLYKSIPPFTTNCDNGDLLCNTITLEIDTGYKPIKMVVEV